MTDSPRQPAAAAPSPFAPGYRLGPIGFAPGVSGVNAWSYLYVNFVIMTLVSFFNFALPYILDELVHVPADQKGRVTAWLITSQEIITLSLIAYVGSLSDRFGRRSLFAAGVGVTALGYALYAFADSIFELYAYRVVFAVGLAMAGTMIAVTAADYPAESSRGKLSGLTGILNGLGVGLATLLFAKLPAVYQGMGFSVEASGRYMLLTVAGLCLVTAVVMQVGLMGGTPTGTRQKVSPFSALRIGIAEGLKNPRLFVCYAGSTASRADLTLVATFISLWLQQAGRNTGLSASESIAKAGLMFGLIQFSSLLWAPVSGILLDRFNRLACLGLALLIASTGYIWFGLQDNPFGVAGYIGAVLTGMGQMGVILSVTALLGQEAPVHVRGSVIGLAGFCGAAGILLTSLVGGYLFDHLSISSPVIFVGLVNFLIFLGALWVWLREGRPVRYDRDAAAPGDPSRLGSP